MVFCFNANAQSSFETKIKENISKIELAKTSNDFALLFDEFSSLTRDSSDEKWKAYYYAAFTKYKEVEVLFSKKNYLELNEKNWLAYKYITAIETLQKTNTDVQDLLKLITQQQTKIQELK